MSVLKNEEWFLNMGPHHPSTHGVLRFIIKSDGEVIDEVKPDVGFLHRGIEKIAEDLEYVQIIPYYDRVDYLAGFNSAWSYVLTVEKLMDIEVPERAEYIRIVMGELNRIISHLISVGSFTLDMGAVTPFTWAIREREVVNDIFEEVTGSRLTYNYPRIGGLANDVPSHFKKKVIAFCDYFIPKLKEFNDLITYQKIFIHRLKNIAVINPEKAIDFGLSGPNLRGSGIKYDLRKNRPYSMYDKIDFNIPVGTGEAGTLGDAYDRYMVRIREMEQSVRIIRQAVELMPDEGPIKAKVPRKIKPPKGSVYAATEAPRGETGVYIESDGSPKPYRMKIRTGSFSAMSIINNLGRNILIADLVAIIGSLDVIAPEIDR